MERPNWGDTVRIKSDAPTEMRPGTLAAVCGMRRVETDEQSRQFTCPIGATVLLVEFGDGYSVELPEDLVEVANE